MAYSTLAPESRAIRGRAHAQRELQIIAIIQIARFCTEPLLHNSHAEEEKKTWQFSDIRVKFWHFVRQFDFTACRARSTKVSFTCIVIDEHVCRK